MTRKCLLGAVLALALFATPAKAEQFYTHPHVKQVICDDAKGSAWRISRGRFATVAHVALHEGCQIMGQPMTVESIDPVGDFATVTIPNDPETGGIPINCTGYADGTWYHALGFARGWPIGVAIEIMAGGPLNMPSILRGWAIFHGTETVIPGMSGAPIIDEFGQAVGSVNAYDDEHGFSWSRPLKETELCHS